MFETTDELTDLQALLDRSHAGATEHLRGIISDERTLRASEVAALMSGMRTLDLATVTARGEPRISAVDGHFLHARWVFSTSLSSGRSLKLTSITVIRCEIAICGAASPIPCAAYMLSNISSTSFLSAASKTVTTAPFCASTGSGHFTTS